jgi:hypothetical protein
MDTDSSAQRFYDIFEMRIILFVTVDFQTLVRLSTTNHTNQSLASKIITTRRDLFLTPFLTSSTIPSLLSLLKRTDAIIFGSIPAICMLPDDDIQSFPLELEIAVPKDRKAAWLAYLRAINFSDKGEAVDTNQLTSTKTQTRFTNKSASFHLLQNQRRPDIPIVGHNCIRE